MNNGPVFVVQRNGYESAGIVGGNYYTDRSKADAKVAELKAMLPDDEGPMWCMKDSDDLALESYDEWAFSVVELKPA